MSLGAGRLSISDAAIRAVVENIAAADEVWAVNEGAGENLKSIGFDLVTTANNHCMDKGYNGLSRTLDVLDQAELKHVGTYRQLKPIYDRYKASRDKEKFLRGHESEIILFEAAARECKRLGAVPLPAT